MSGFFNTATLTKARITHLSTPKCGACGLYSDCNSPKLAPVHPQGASTLLVFSYPNYYCDEQGVHVLPSSFRRLAAAFREHEITKQDVAITSAVICHPDGDPDEKQIEACLPNLLKVIHDVKPIRILVFGQTAVSSLISHLWQDAAGKESRWWKWCIPSVELNAWVMCFPNLYMLDQDRVPAGLCQVFDEGMRIILSKTKRPWKRTPTDACTLYSEPSAAVDHIEQIIEAGMPCAIDYETNMLKPDGSDARIVCAGICQAGDATIAFPWSSQIATAMKKFVQSPIKKIAANMKFEDRWTRAILGCSVRNFVWDTMQAAHVLDNRPEISGVKFQSFARLGRARYDRKVKPYLASEDSRSPNKIDQLPLPLLLKYCALDNLYEYEIAQQQMREMGYEL